MTKKRDIDDVEKFNRAFDQSIELLAAEEELNKTIDVTKRIKLEQKIRGLNQKITPAAIRAALASRRFVLTEWDAWVAVDNPESFKLFMDHLQAQGGAMRDRKGSSAPLKEGAVRSILSIHRGLVGKRGRPRKIK